MTASQLPRIMVAPTGARRSPGDHPGLPMLIPDIVADARACFAAGAGAIHAHVRDAEGKHSLDHGLYRELLAELAAAVPDLIVQITTEAMGRYDPPEQRSLVTALRPKQVSIALREMIAEQDQETVRQFYHWARTAGINIQHILYTPQEIRMMQDHVDRGIIPAGDIELMFVLGQYAGARDSQPDDLDAYVAERQGHLAESGWAVCAFGRNETACLVKAIGLGGKARIGFENNLMNSDGTVAKTNAERIGELIGALAVAGLT